MKRPAEHRRLCGHFTAISTELHKQQCYLSPPCVYFVVDRSYIPSPSPFFVKIIGSNNYTHIHHAVVAIYNYYCRQSSSVHLQQIRWRSRGLWLRR